MANEKPALSERQQKAVDDVCDAIFYHVSDVTHRQKLKVCFTLLAELLVQDTDAAKEAIAEAAQKLASAYAPKIIISCPRCGKTTEVPRIATDPPTAAIEKLCGNCTGGRHVPKAKRIR